jgi:hypothetical protein
MSVSQSQSYSNKDPLDNQALEYKWSKNKKKKETTKTIFKQQQYRNSY